MARPRPVPCPTGLVVKKGSVARARTSGAMPWPVSATSSSTPPGRRRVRRVMAPPSGMASRALMDRFMMALPRRPASPRIRGSPSSRSTMTETFWRSVRRRIPSSWRTRSLRSRSAASARSLRAKWVRLFTRPLPRSVAWMMVPRALAWGASSGKENERVSARLRMAVSTLFMSWATPPARAPRLSSFWAWWSSRSMRACSASMALRSVRSVWVPVMRMGRPSASRRVTLPRVRIHFQPPSLVRRRCSTWKRSRPPSRYAARLRRVSSRSSGWTSSFHTRMTAGSSSPWKPRIWQPRGLRYTPPVVMSTSQMPSLAPSRALRSRSSFTRSDSSARARCASPSRWSRAKETLAAALSSNPISCSPKKFSSEE